jgi:hypothetical protein
MLPANMRQAIAPEVALRAFFEERRRCGELNGGVEDGRLWMTCECGAKISLPREAAHANRPT